MDNAIHHTSTLTQAVRTQWSQFIFTGRRWK